ncbi:MAG: crossover junction endodeoxyribonuclease RuvC [Rhodospirillales bacterium]|jgi:crossover junction endodeoxyribonuclease RuvC|nr:crossover junction endodeoxyribonuclease RuvC [Rhodospirillales bacterium]MDP7600014.1 crossover junction endodeoxyribonuclease RuvC [Rhodospirillales bacterium]|tara:strand:- start:653 stop:1171 length:519 start_codon:yes stop_codon:yes gene_type:complete
MRLLGIDPGLRNTGWGIIESDGNRLTYVGDGVVKSDAALSLAERLVQLHDGLTQILEDFQPAEVAVEETFVNVNAASTLKLGQARGIALFVPSKFGLPVAEYSPNLVKKSLVGSGHAAKEQVQMMIKTLLPGCDFQSTDSADALAIAICHAHHRGSAVHQAALMAVAQETSV